MKQNYLQKELLGSKCNRISSNRRDILTGTNNVIGQSVTSNVLSALREVVAENAQFFISKEGKATFRTEIIDYLILLSMFRYL